MWFLSIWRLVRLANSTCLPSLIALILDSRIFILLSKNLIFSSVSLVVVVPVINFNSLKPVIGIVLDKSFNLLLNDLICLIFFSISTFKIKLFTTFKFLFKL